MPAQPTPTPGLIDLLGPFLVVGVLLYILGQMRRWLYQHIFKVGWLLTKNLRSTTALFYTIFLPGVVVFEFFYWLAAGIFDVRAERSLGWPESQQVAELRLNFVKVAKNIGRLRLAAITLMPFVACVLIIWWVAQSQLGIEAFAGALRERGVRALGPALGQLFSTPDFFLWVYLLFTIGNTMMPRWEDLRGVRVLLIAVGVLVVILFALGVGDEVLIETFLVPIGTAVNLVSSVFLVIIGVNVLVTAALGTIESIIERVTGDSATFQNGKLVAITRAELIEQRRKAAEQAAKQQKAAREKKPTIPAGPPSIYRLPLPTPGAPGRDVQPAAENVTIRRDEQRTLIAGSPALDAGQADAVRPTPSPLAPSAQQSQQPPQPSLPSRQRPPLPSAPPAPQTRPPAAGQQPAAARPPLTGMQPSTPRPTAPSGQPTTPPSVSPQRPPGSPLTQPSTTPKPNDSERMQTARTDEDRPLRPPIGAGLPPAARPSAAPKSTSVEGLWDDMAEDQDDEEEAYDD